jgi:hypothetical protein
MHMQQSWHVIGQGCWMSLGKALLLLVQWDSQSSLKCNSIWLMYQHLAVIHHWILPHKDCLHNNKNKSMPMLDPCKNVHVKIQCRFIQIIFFIESSRNRPYLCGNFLLHLCQMFMTLFHESCFFLWGKQFILFLVGNRIDWLNLTFLFRRGRLSMFFVFNSIFLIRKLSDQEQETYNVSFVQQYYSSQIGLCLQVKEILVSFYVHQHWFVTF